VTIGPRHDGRVTTKLLALLRLPATGLRRLPLPPLTIFEVPLEPAHVLIERLEADLSASVIEALSVLDRRRDGNAILVWPHLSAEDLSASFVHSHAIGQVGELARRCLAAGGRVRQQFERLTLNRGLVVCMLGDQPGVVSALLSNE
jgi:hypothetical protein